MTPHAHTVSRTIIYGAYIATVDAAGTEYSDGFLVVDDDTIIAVGSGQVPRWATDGEPADQSGREGSAESTAGARSAESAGRANGEPRASVTLVDARGHLVTPGLIN